MSTGDVADPAEPGSRGPALWIGLPTACPTCGATVDQAVACRALDPRCPFCRDPLPCRPFLVPGASEVAERPEAPALRASGTSTTFHADVHLLTKAEGGRHTPIFSGYRPEIVVAGETISVTVTFEPPVQMGVPGEDIPCSIELPSAMALQAGQGFDVVEGARVVGRGSVRGVV